MAMEPPPSITATRSLARADAKTLPAGGAHYSAYVGPPQHYDLMGASQFRLLCTLGMRDHSKVLDFGCGSLRVGRLLLPYLLPGNYYGIDPNQWLIEDAIRNEVGADQIRIKRPNFAHNGDYRVDGFGVKFDFIIAQSIFSHCGRDLIETALANFQGSLADNGLILATFVHQGSAGIDQEFSGNGWVYPGCVAYAPESVFGFIKQAGLVGDWIPWHHWQDWYVMARTRRTLPPKAKHVHLSGAVLRDRDFAGSS